MLAKYLIRFDDLCPTMNWDVWQEIETLLNWFNIKPILAVVPSNRDPELEVMAPVNDFWKHVRKWQLQGWTIGLHGYQHQYITQNPGILGINAYSEFAGLTEQEQYSKIRSAIDIFDRESVQPQIWVAPAHSFDWTTIQVLGTLGIKVISDGFSIYPFIGKHESFWIPQQLWRFYNLPFGLYTVCYHHSNWSDLDLKNFQKNLEKYKSRITSYEEVIEEYSCRRKTLLDKVGIHFLPVLIHLKRKLSCICK